MNNITKPEGSQIMEFTKVLEVLSKHIIKVEEENQFKDWEIKKLKEKLNKIENHIDRYY